MRTDRGATGGHWRTSYALVAVVAMACAPAARAPIPVAATQHVVVFSDLHFNPFADPALVDSLANADVARWRTILGASTQTAFSQYGSDTNYPLLASALAAMRRAEPEARLVLFAGDFMAHNFQSNFRKTARDTSAAALATFTDKTNQFLAQQIADAFPNAQILPALGNNDSACGDYMSEPGSDFLRSFANAWQPMVSRHGAAPAFVETFSRAGHFAAYAPVLGARVVVLNDVYWSPRYSNACGLPAARPERDVLPWLEGVLADSRSRNERVWLLTHVPLGVDVFATLKGDSLVNMLDPASVSELVSLLRRYGSTVRYGIYGHTHMNEFRIVSDDRGAPLIAAQGVPSVSPNVGTNPAFMVLSVDSAGAIADYTVHTLTNLPVAGAGALAVWSKEYDFGDTFGGGGLSARSLDRLYRTLATDSATRARYIRFYDSESGRSKLKSQWQSYWCGMENIQPTAFTRCVREQ